MNSILKSLLKNNSEKSILLFLWSFIKYEIKDFFPPLYPIGDITGNISFSFKLIVFSKALLLKLAPSHTESRPKEVQYKIAFSNVYPNASKSK